MRSLLLLTMMALGLSVYGQKKALDHSDFEIWNTIEGQSISNDGKFIMYSLERGERDNFLKVHSNDGELILEHDRASGGRFTFDSRYAIFRITAWADSLTEMKRRKVKKDDMPKDSLGILDIRNGEIVKIPSLNSFKIPEKWGGYLAYQVEPGKTKPNKETEEAGTEEEGEKKKVKKQNKKNGFHLILRDLATADQDTFKYVTGYTFAREGAVMAFTSSGDDEEMEAGVYVYNLETSTLENPFAAEGKFPKLSLSENGQRLAFIADLDTTETRIRPFEVYTWNMGDQLVRRIVSNDEAPQGYLVTSNGNLNFSKNGDRLFFGFATPPVLKDTSLVDEEIVNVEVWTYDEPRLYTVQELRASRDRNKSYTAVVHMDDPEQVIQLETVEYPDLNLSRDGQEDRALVYTSLPYQLESQWLGGSSRDYALVNVRTGELESIRSNVRGFLSLSPGNKYVYGYEMADSTWISYNISDGEWTDLTAGKVFYDEMNDSPTYPRQYGSAGWTEDDGKVYLYDRYDLWETDPDGGEMKRVTQGREGKKVYRYLRLDNEERFLPDGKWLMSEFHETTKDAGYYELDSGKGSGKTLVSGPYRFSRPQKAQDGKGLIFTRASFVEFPDIRYSDRSFRKVTKISDANPQQSEYNWGTSELVHWTSLDGKTLEGILIKPENFDPNKKYPMLVNFYETSSDGLNSHRTPLRGRSTINYSFYTSRGYLIFNPNVHYRIGYPGESAYNCVIPGVTSLIEKGFVDKDRIGVQGHSWGGYQIAYLITRTNIFRAAEAGAPVVNMISAYGGIRWGSGLSRQFQYEHTQSRIGGSPWEYPARYIENSPIFVMDKVETPVLILHNDEDGAVPWYQGIEMLTALRRLGKPAWMLNYNGEPHWPLKLQNRTDFNIRMQQFFDYYLMGSPMPKWMKDGVPAIEKSINQNLELLDDSRK